MSNSPSGKKSNNQTPDIQFTTGNIGRWASQQEDPFAEQNRKRAVKKHTRNQKRQKAAPIIVIISGVILATAAIVGLIFLIIHLSNRRPNEVPEISGGTTQDITNYRDVLQNFYNQRPDATEDEKLQAVQDAVNGTLDTANGREYEAQVKLAQALFYFDKGMYENASKTGSEIDESKMSLEDKRLYYNIMYYCYGKMGQQKLSDEYLAKLYEVANELSGQEYEEYEKRGEKE